MKIVKSHQVGENKEFKQGPLSGNETIVT